MPRRQKIVCPTNLIPIQDMDVVRICPGVWMGGLHTFADCGQIGIKGIHRAVVLAPDAGVDVVHPDSYTLALRDSKSDLLKIPRIRLLVNSLAAEVKRGCKIAIFCNEGRNRSGLITALLLRKMYGWNGSQAVAWIKSLRANSLTNEAFENYLNALS